MSKRKARESPYILECERIKKQQIRQEKRKFYGNSEINVPRKRRKHDTETLPKTWQKDTVTIEESIKQFQSDISIGPIYVWFVHVVTKHGLGSVFPCLRILIFLQKVEDNIALVLHLSIMKSGFVILA